MAVMRYYEGHEAVYQRLSASGARSWDEFLGQAEDFDDFCMRPFLEAALRRSTFSVARPLALEVGCGTGPASCFLAARGFRVEGIDVSPTAIAIAKEQAKARGLDVSYRVLDLCRPELDQDRYDLIVDGHCIHCIATDDDRQRALASIRSALRPTGAFWMEAMVAFPSTSFGDDALHDDSGILWVARGQAGEFDLERRIGTRSYVASRRIPRDPGPLETELVAAGFSIAWSEVTPPEAHHEPGNFRAICTVSGASAGG